MHLIFFRSSPSPPSPSPAQVVAGAVPDSFTGVPGMGSPQNEGPKGFMEILFGKNPNKGKVRRHAEFDSVAPRVAERERTRSVT